MILFVSDLHLSPATPAVTHLFVDFLAGRARAAERLFILGDLFEAWPGDDCLEDGEDLLAATVVGALREVVGSGVEVSLLHGNRDFLLGEGFAARSGVRLLPDPFVLSLPTWQFVLSHGDALCIDDTDYQTFRAMVRQEAWQKAFLARPLAERRAIAMAVREQSEVAKRGKAGYLMDVNLGATEDFLRANGYATLIHGHTHRPAMHEHIVDGIAVERWVLADWSHTRGECLCWDGEQLLRESLVPQPAT
ncbi:UDP-2,3-diacylglucosamine diphosphatase [Accumulibacter sp.]|uniref:UDP-2,3-diacylglucosamine diphosphatase n=1 Tax=Accumulibacter sp. TaxID=2053492 RepID=UPI0025E8C5A8|nr:UDP-2,3-diacylglucosamine diphosphatase [Accumulibacter sp.]MCM8594303.1 UDP-2,3-diacylglucosamine diphosphatase [Accumulibacter sp.]MCM8627874.1 UDP-2,3-diacylglucosamine diphosphatase [Accumulibacter sp.]MDS4048447.1 UDP-2,3-diacylglucosamine diphosphatase [Accumulibacter sp.]